jgi:hypothetical protein
MKKRHLLSTGLIGLVFLGLVAGRGLGGDATTRAADPPSGSWSCGMTSGNWGDWGQMWGDGDHMGSGMMGGGNMMDGWNMSGGMWGTMGNMGMMGSFASTATPITEADAQQRLATFAAGCGQDVQVADVMAFGSNYYAQLVDGSGNGLLEVLVDRYTGAVYPEPGPNMMWNNRWGVDAGTSSAARL